MSEMESKYAELRQLIEAHKDWPGALMPVLQGAQEIFGCVPEDVQKIIAEGLGVTLSEVYGVATFYSQFSLQPKGEYVISVCLGTACYVKGSQSVLDKLSEIRWAAPPRTAASPCRPRAAWAPAVLRL